MHKKRQANHIAPLQPPTLAPVKAWGSSEGAGRIAPASAFGNRCAKVHTAPLNGQATDASAFRSANAPLVYVPRDPTDSSSSEKPGAKVLLFFELTKLF